MKKFTNTSQVIPYAPKTLEIVAPEGFEFKMSPTGKSFVYRVPENAEEYFLADNGTSVYNLKSFRPSSARLILTKLPEPLPPKVEVSRPEPWSAYKKPTIAFKHVDTRAAIKKGEWYISSEYGISHLSYDFTFSKPYEIYERIEL